MLLWALALAAVTTAANQLVSADRRAGTLGWALHPGGCFQTEQRFMVPIEGNANWGLRRVTGVGFPGTPPLNDDYRYLFVRGGILQANVLAPGHHTRLTLMRSSVVVGEFWLSSNISVPVEKGMHAYVDLSTVTAGAVVLFNYAGFEGPDTVDAPLDGNPGFFAPRTDNFRVASNCAEWVGGEATSGRMVFTANGQVTINSLQGAMVYKCDCQASACSEHGVNNPSFPVETGDMVIVRRGTAELVMCTEGNHSRHPTRPPSTPPTSPPSHPGFFSVTQTGGCEVVGNTNGEARFCTAGYLQGLNYPNQGCRITTLVDVVLTPAHFELEPNFDYLLIGDDMYSQRSPPPPGLLVPAGTDIVFVPDESVGACGFDIVVTRATSNPTMAPAVPDSAAPSAAPHASPTEPAPPPSAAPSAGPVVAVPGGDGDGPGGFDSREAHTQAASSPGLLGRIRGYFYYYAHHAVRGGGGDDGAYD